MRTIAMLAAGVELSIACQSVVGDAIIAIDSIALVLSEYINMTSTRKSMTCEQEQEVRIHQSQAVEIRQCIWQFSCSGLTLGCAAPALRSGA